MTTVIFHNADFDGIFCREIAKKFLAHDENCDTQDRNPDGISKPCNCTQYIGWNFGDPPIEFPATGLVYVMDLPLDKPFIGYPNPSVPDERIVWIDHHKSAIESHPGSIPGYRIDGVAACRLAWHYFTAKPPWANKHNFVNREVGEPLAVQLAGEYDVWDHRGDGDLEFQFGLDSEEDLRWDWLFDGTPDSAAYTRHIVAQGKCSMTCYRKRDSDVMHTRSFVTSWEGLKFLTLTTAKCNSQTFEALDVPETGHDALMAFYYNGSKWVFSLYHAKHRNDLDLSTIAVKHGGGGHRGACGFTCANLPFLQ